MTNKVSEKKDRSNIVLYLAAGFLILIILYGIFGSSVDTTNMVENLFIDVNGDGLVDLVKNADVILNTGSNINFP